MFVQPPLRRLYIIVADALLAASALFASSCTQGDDPTVQPQVTRTGASPATPQIASQIAPAPGTRWVHPGATSSAEELAFVRARIDAGEQPWTDEYEQASRSPHANRTPHPLRHINSATDDANVSRDDAIGAYTQALLWRLGGDEAYARKSIAILDAWSDLQGFTAGSDQDKLQAGWIGAVLAPAAEIMRGYSGWAPADISRLQAMFKRAFYPQLMKASAWNGNVDLTQIDAMLGIAVFNEDQALFDAGIARWKARVPSYIYLKAQGAVPRIDGDGGNVQAFWSNPTQWVDGLQQETRRDNGHHAQFGLGSALHAAETAWHQGVDLYTAETARFTAALELMALQFLSGDMQGVCANAAPSADRYDAWEIGFNHYHNRAGIALPNTERLILTQIRPKASRTDWNLAYETLTHTGVR